MLHGVIDTPPALKLARHYRLPRAKALLVAMCVSVALVALAAWAAARPALADLGNPHTLHSSGLHSAWSKGSVIVVIRHAERCDRSRGACLDDPTGITLAGSRVAADVGQGLQRLGLRSADVWASPEVRTRQTAQFMFGKAITTQDWLNQCDHTFASNAFAHKQPGRNLVLVSHSGCLEQVERQLNVDTDADSNRYASALFITQGDDGKARVLGQMDASQWRKLADAREI
ncbi:MULTISPECIES: histidine phosphatase family protein [unclassified Pseudomonas]|uniref:lipopolysaccharide core heptose(II)-phosphate phosphatase PmrG n=1 Tax=unclassified Pseudomonas TaxID=196821 RepID=UPI000A098F68|nr:MULTISPECIES: histidine phosphatase family protein [unclassified Pseudomonas]SMF19360.1 Phosphohistidine phosphatase SixA [Pseudomonas sp. LAIL14HWK12:I11]SMR77203.1 Phosphohistidine phosphatase SixA [Pseudomonas sp. LAIL14HWK12:I10]SOD03022.1 Phosphohistidine phosphatase SixA [Pseudomonas sp. LAIL14HWK12:I8]